MHVPISKLTLEDRTAIARILNLDLENNMDRRLSDNVIACPHCKHSEIKKVGKTRGKQRYKCKSCKKTFGARTNKAFHYTNKDIAVWEDFLEAMFVDRKSLRKIAEQLDICLTTAFHWRHKVLNALDAIENETLDVIVEADETYMQLSYKGSRNLPRGRKARKRGGRAKKRGLSKEKVCVMTAIDRTGKSLFKSACLAAPNKQEITNVLGAHVARGAVLVTDGLLGYRGFAKDLDLMHVVLTSATEVRDAYHVQNVNSMHYNFKKRFMTPFNGVATKYLDNYLAYYKWHKQNYAAALARPTASVTWAELRARRMTLK